MQNHLKTLLGLAFLFVSLQARAAAPPKEWNFLVFLNGVNNLDSFGTLNINQMEEIGSNDRLNIIVQWGSAARPSVDRLLVQKDNDGARVTSPVVKSLGPVDMGDDRSLVDFVRWSQENYPSNHTFVVVWNHGSGWHRPQLLGDDYRPRDISNDDRTGHKITTEQLAVAMSDIAAAIGRRVDIYGSDACLMGMAEVADQMSNSVNVFVGSQDLEPGEGWPYSTFLRAWTDRMDMGAADVAKTLSREFLAAYNGGIYGRQSVTLSVFDLRFMGVYRAAVRDLAAQLTALPASAMSRLRAAAKSTKSFFSSDYRDLIDFTNQAGLAALMPAAVAGLREAHAQFVIANDQNQDAVTSGLSVWLPTDKRDVNSYWARYSQLTFHRTTGWGDFIRKLF